MTHLDFPPVKFAELKELRSGTHLHQIEDGTIFYLDLNSPPRIYVERKDKEVDAILPAAIEAKSVIAHGNTLYFAAECKVYAAEFVAGVIDVRYIRDVLKDEKVGGTFQQGCTHVRDGETYVYRLCDDPFKDGIPIGAIDREVNDQYTQLACIHRGKAIYSRHHTNNDRSFTPVPARKLSENVILIELAHPFILSHAIDSSSFIYIFSHQYHLVHTFETDTMTFQPTLSDDVKKHSKSCMLYNIAGIRHGEITAKVWEHGSDRIWSINARLPDTHVKEDQMYHVRLAMDKLAYRHNQLEKKEQELKAAMEAQNDEVLTMQKLLKCKM